MDMSSMKEDQVVHDPTQVVGNSGALSTMMGLHDVLRNIKQMLVPFKRYIEASAAGMAPQMNIHSIQSNNKMAQASPMTQALPITQTTHANVPTSNAKEPKFIMPEKFDGTRSKFCGFVQQVNLFLWLHSSCHPNDST
jgi:hypothetical protein